MKRVAAIDFGSNAIRLTIADIVSKGRYKVIEKFRFPVRIGAEVFSTGEIGAYKQDEICEVFKKFRGHIRYFHAEDISAVATSALRDAKNSELVLKKIQDISDIKVQLITGHEEASFIYDILSSEYPIAEGNVLLVDIGGGSTELVFLKDGKIQKQESFNNGTLRTPKDSEQIIVQMKSLIKSQFSKATKVKVIATGGNLRRLGKLRKKFFNKDSGTQIEKDEVFMLYEQMKNLSPFQITKKYDLKDDRAEVIVPALRIFSNVLEELEPEVIYLPKLGLSDSLLYHMSLTVSSQT